MARIVSSPYSLPRALGTRTHVGRVTAVGAVIALLSLVGSAVTLANVRLQRRLAVWSEARRLRAEDRQMWQQALADPRLMAELVALQQRREGGL